MQGLAVAWPFGYTARFTDTGGVQTRGACSERSRRAQTLLAFSPVSVALLGQATRPGNPLKEKVDGLTTTHVGEDEWGEKMDAR